MKNRISIRYFWSEGVHNIFLHGFMSFAAVSIMIACLLITGTVALLSYNIDQNIVALQQESEIVVFVSETVSPNDSRALEQKLEEIENVRAATFRSGEEALRTFSENAGDDLLEGIPNDRQILRDEYHITLVDASLIGETLDEILKLPEVAKHRANQDTVSMLVTVQQVFGLVAWGLIIALGCISIFIISNTVKLAMFTRRDEIAIQKMVGATNWFIRWPFVIEGLLLGLTAGAVAFFAQWGIYAKLVDVMSSILKVFDMAPFSQIRSIVLVIFLIAGVSIGVGGSVLTIRRFMDV